MAWRRGLVRGRLGRGTGRGWPSKRAGWAEPWSWSQEDEKGHQHRETEIQGEGGAQLSGSRTYPSNNCAEAPLVPLLPPVSRGTARVGLGQPSWLTACLPARLPMATAPSPNTHSWLSTALPLLSWVALGKWPNPWPQFPSG